MTEKTESEKMEEAVSKIDSGSSMRAAALETGVAYTTLHRHYQARLHETPLPTSGRAPSIPIETQVELAELARVASTHGLGVTRQELQDFIGKFVEGNWNCETDLGRYLQKNCQFRDFYPSDAFMTKFLKDHNLSLLIPSAQDKLRQDATTNPFRIYGFYDTLESEMARLNLFDSPGSIWNVDESAFFLDPHRGRVVAKRGSSVQRITAGIGRECVTAVGTACATGEILPPLIIYPSKHLYASWQGQKAMPGMMYACSGKYYNCYLPSFSLENISTIFLFFLSHRKWMDDRSHLPQLFRQFYSPNPW